MAVSCDWVASSVRAVSCFLERKVSAFRDTFLTYVFVVSARYKGVSLYFVLNFDRVSAVLENSCLCYESVHWSAILFEIAKIVSVKCVVYLGLDMLFEKFPALADAFLFFCR